MQPLLSIIIPAYNEENYLPRLLRSIDKQLYRNREIIVADANSSDATRDIAKNFGAKVIEGGMPAYGRNAGARIARGDIFLFLDADVILPEPSFLSRVIAEFEKKKIDLATCLPLPISHKKIDHLFHRAFNIYTKLLKNLLPHTPGFCIMARRELHYQIGGFDEKIKLAEDHDYARRAVKFGRFGLLSYKIPVSIRRFERDGRLKIAVKYIFCELHMFTFGAVRNNLFNYRFGYDAKDRTEAKNKIKI